MAEDLGWPPSLPSVPSCCVSTKTRKKEERKGGHVSHISQLRDLSYLKECVASVQFKHDAAYAPHITRMTPAKFCSHTTQQNTS